jgi:hypothetical protein
VDRTQRARRRVRLPVVSDLAELESADTPLRALLG